MGVGNLMGRRAKSTTDKTLDFLKSVGMDTSKIEGLLENVRDYRDLDFISEKVYWQANSNATFLKKWSRVALFKTCDHCGKQFATNYHGVAYCSTSCGAKAFTAMTKMPWKYTRKAYSKSLEEKWKEYEPPQTVDADFLATLEYIYLELQKAIQEGKTQVYQSLPDTPDESDPFENEELGGFSLEDLELSEPNQIEFDEFQMEDF